MQLHWTNRLSQGEIKKWKDSNELEKLQDQKKL